MRTPRGQLDRRITIQSGQAVRGALGRETETIWADHCKAWARVLFGTGQERREAAAEGASQSATFRVLSSAKTRTVTERFRILFDGRAWDITSIAPIGVNDEIEFTATVAKG
ncbi:MAG TPA: phage head closure protein [Sphingomonas sp.]